ncbi:MAG: hypothetical protein KGD63_09295 [Candidatus Lokiarchaeota archaeon]|nr:hypothetical protein [Candidatus Lokiarchaeota archaeon]
MITQNRKIIILGSIAYDYLFSFPEKFINAVSINFEKEEYQSTITTNKKIVRFGGIAGNIAYNIGLLNITQALIIGAVGKDFKDLGYQEHLSKFNNIKIDVDMHIDESTATCYIVNDINTNQMIIFHGGALNKSIDIDLTKRVKNPKNYFYAINSAQSVNAMKNHAKQLNDMNIPFIFDPGQVTPLFTKESLDYIIKKSEIIIGNKFEIEQILKKTEMTTEELLETNSAIITTLGKDGCTLLLKKDNNKTLEELISACKIENIKDTTGAGDAFRGGFLTGLSLNMSLNDSCRLGSVIASFTIETDGAQTHSLDLLKVEKRYLDNYGNIPLELKKIIKSSD